MAVGIVTRIKALFRILKKFPTISFFVDRDVLRPNMTNIVCRGEGFLSII